MNLVIKILGCTIIKVAGGGWRIFSLQDFFSLNVFFLKSLTIPCMISFVFFIPHPFPTTTFLMVHPLGNFD